ncbi:MAG: WecB/TagA/CpsF family glycosyltransferase [Streptosporangiaceae bacterium]
MAAAATAPSAPAGRIRLGEIDLDPLTEAQVVQVIMDAAAQGQGGWVVTPNVDQCQAARRDPALAALIASASLAVADGMPLVWASRMLGQPLPERVTGAALIFSVSQAAARESRSVYLLGGEPGVPGQAASALIARYGDLKVAGTDAPPVGFDASPAGVAEVREKLTLAAPDIVFVGLGFPRQEKLITELAGELPGAWFIACGAAIPFAAGALPRAPEWMQRSGLEWLYRLASEPRRLFRRYLIQDLPFALRLLVTARRQGRSGRRASR